MDERGQALEAILMQLFPRLAKQGDIRPECALRDDLGLDSLDLVNLMVAIEDTFDVRFDPISTDLVAVFSTVGSLAAYLAGSVR